VTVQFAVSVVNDVDQRMIDGLKHCIRAQIANGQHLLNIYISSAFDSHKMPIRHMQHKAVDISRVNGMKWGDLGSHQAKQLKIYKIVDMKGAYRGQYGIF
jgi:hypothetical protein